MGLHSSIFNIAQSDNKYTNISVLASVLILYLKKLKFCADIHSQLFYSSILYLYSQSLSL